MKYQNKQYSSDFKLFFNLILTKIVQPDLYPELKYVIRVQGNGASLGLGLSYVAFLLVPGLIAVKMSLIANQRIDDYSRFDKLVYSALWGLLTLAVMLLLIEDCWRVGISNTVTNFGQSTAGNWCGEASDLESVSGSPIGLLLGIIGVQSSIGCILGFCWGKFQFYRTNALVNEDYSTQPWDEATDWTEGGHKVSAVMSDGREIEGKVHQIGSSDEYDLLLKAPKLIQRDDDGNINSDDSNYLDANLIYIHHQDVSQVIFYESYGIDEERFDTHREWIRNLLKRLYNWIRAKWKLLLGIIWSPVYLVYVAIVACYARR